MRLKRQLFFETLTFGDHRHFNAFIGLQADDQLVGEVRATAKNIVG